jgi:deoxyhypusine monooxygenase
VQYTKSDERLSIIEEMEAEFDKKNTEYFRTMLKHEDYVIRTRAVCILADIAGEDAVDAISDVLLNDPDGLVRHEAAFSLGHMGFRSAIQALGKAIEVDENPFVRHEAAVALGVIGSQEARNILTKALNDKSEEVRESAVIALSNIDFVSQLKDQNSRFAKMTGG